MELDPQQDPFSREAVQHLVARYGSPLFVIDAERVRRQYRRLAAALPGVVAAHTDLPVIGVPLTSRTSVAGGLDALLVPDIEADAIRPGADASGVGQALQHRGGASSIRGA